MIDEPKRLAPSKETLNLLFALSGNECAFHGCKERLIDEDNLFIGQVCHIEAAMPGGERFNKNCSNEDRRKPDNLILLCYKHHIKTNNVDKYSADNLRKIKSDHEAKFRGSDYKVNYNLIDKIYNSLLDSIKEDTSYIRKGSDEIKSGVAGIKDQTDQILSVLEKLQSHTPASAFGTQINTIMKLRDTNDYNTAIQQLISFKAEHWKKLSSEEKYRVLANLGICHFELLENRSAAQYFKEAYEHQPEKVRAVTLAAMGYAIEEDLDPLEHLVEKALSMDPNNTEAYSALLMGYRNKPVFEEILDRIPEQVREHSEVALALAHNAKMLPNFEEAVKWAQLALDNGKGNQIDLKSSLASIILESILDEFFIIHGQVSHDNIAKAKYVIQLYNEAWDAIKTTHLAKSRAWWLINRGIAKRINQDIQGSFEDMLEGCSYDPSYENLRQLSISAISLNNFNKASETVSKMEQIASEDQKTEVLLLKAELYHLQKRYPEAINIAESLSIVDEKQRENIQLLLIELYRKVGDSLSELDLIDKMIEEQPTHILPYIQKAEYFLRYNSPAEANEFLNIALQLVTPETLSKDLHELADALHTVERYGEAIKLYEKFVDLNVYSRFTEILLTLYYKAGETKKLLTCCNSLIEKQGPNSKLTEYQCISYEQASDIPKAIECCLSYLNYYPEDQVVIFRLVILYDRCNYKEKLIELLRRVEHFDSRVRFEIHYRVARIIYEIGDKEKCYRLSYETWKRNIKNKSSNEMFFTLLIAVEGPTVPHPDDPQMVNSNCVVFLENEEKLTSHYIICSRHDDRSFIEEISEDDNIARSLVGKKIGDVVYFNEYLTSKPFTIVRILHKYNFACLEANRLLKTVFIDGSSFQTVRFGNTGNTREDFKPLLEQLDDFADSQRKADEIYKSGLVPLGLIASNRSTNPIKVWSNYLSWQSPGIFTTIDSSEFEPAFKALDDQQGILIDVISICSLQSLCLLDQVAELPNVKSIAQSSIDHLFDLLKELKSDSGGSITIGKVNNTYVRHITTKEEVALQVDRLEKLTTWIANNCTVLPCYESINMPADEKAKLDEALDRSVIESILIAREKSYLLYSEEGVIRGFARNEYKIDSLSSFIFITYLVSKDLVDKEIYYDVIKKLIYMNYKVIPVDSEILIRILMEVGMIDHPVFKFALEGLKSNLVGGENAVNVSMIFFDKLLNDNVSHELSSASTKKEAIRVTLERLVQYYHPIPNVKAIIYKRLHLIKNQASATIVKEITDEFFGAFGF